MGERNSSQDICQKQAQVFDLMTECVECIEYIECIVVYWRYIVYIGDIVHKGGTPHVKLINSTEKTQKCSERQNRCVDDKTYYAS